MMHLTSPLVTEDFTKMTTIMEVGKPNSRKIHMNSHWNHLVFHSKSQKNVENLIHRFQVSPKWRKVKSRSHSNHVNFAHDPTLVLGGCDGFTNLNLPNFQIIWKLWIKDRSISSLLLFECQCQPLIGSTKKEWTKENIFPEGYI